MLSNHFSNKYTKNYILFIVLLFVLIINLKSENVFEINSQAFALNYQVEKGQNIYNLTNLFFNSPQTIKIQQFINQQSNKSKPLCQKQVFQQSIMSNQTHAYYNIKLDWDKYFKPIYQFSQIQNYKAALDVIQFKGFFIILFEFGQFSYFTLPKKGNKVFINQTYSGMVNMSSNYVSQGNFVIANNQCIFFSQKQAIRFYENGTTKILKNYKPIGKQFQIAKKYDGDCVIIASAQKGISHYMVGEDDLQFLGQSQIFTRQKNQDKVQRLYLQIVDVQFDSNYQIMYFLDPQQGLFKAQFDNSNINQTQILVQPTKIVIDLCQNLKISEDKLYMTCPNLIIYDVNTGDYRQNLTRLEFIPNHIIKNESSGRLILFGDYNFGYFDELDGQFSFGQISNYLTKALIYEDMFLMFNDFFVFVGRIIPEISNLHCFGDPDMVGLNNGILSIQGSCSTYDPNNLVIVDKSQENGVNLNGSSNKTAPVQNIPKKGMCQLRIPISLTVIDNQSFVLKVFEIIICVGLIWFTLAMIIYFSVRHIKVRQDYQILQQEATEVRTDIKQNKSQQIQQKVSQPHQE